MRRLCWFTVGAAIAALSSIYLFWEADRNFILLGTLVLFLASVFAGVKFRRIRLMIPLSLGLLAGFLWFAVYQNTYISPIRSLDGQTVPLEIEVSTFSEESRYSMTCDGRLFYSGKTYKVRVYFSDDVSAKPGDILRSDFRLRLTAPGAQKESAYYQGNGIFLVASQKGDCSVIHCDRITPKTFPQYLAKSMKESIEIWFPSDTAPFAKALLLGDTSDLDYVTDTALKISGIRHVAAVSGLHIAMLYGLIVFVLGQRKKIATFIALLVLAVFASAAGFTPSVTRACIMTGLMAISMMLNREYDAFTALAFACLVMIGWNPFVVTSVSFQLSVASVLGILLFAGKLFAAINTRLSALGKSKLGKIIGGFLASSLAVTVSAMSFTTPLSIYYFDMVSIIGIVTNLLTMWCISFIFCGISLVCMIGYFLPAAAQIAADGISVLIRFTLFTARALARFPLAAVYTASKYILVWIAVCYILFAIFFLVKKKGGLYLTAVSILCFIWAISCSWLIPRQDNSRLEVIYVGEGQSILLQSRGETLLIDCGGSDDANAANNTAQALLSMGIRKLDHIAVTHYDRDHVGGIANLLTRVEACQLLLPDQEDKGFLETIPYYPKEQILRISEDTQFTLGSANVTLFKPGNYKTENENCMCILFEAENCVILVTGDRGKQGEKQLIREHDLPDTDILIAGHHGSKNSTSQELLDAVTPEVVVVSCGINNSYGHPAQELLDRLEENHCEIYRTDLQGNIVIRR